MEIVSRSDERETPWTAKLGKYHRLGVREVVRFDPESAELRIWDAVEGDLVERVLTPGQSIECVPLELYWVVAPSEKSDVMLRLSRDEAGQDLLPTAEDEREAARAEREAALDRVRVLEEELRRRG